jgi:hypothetical protein
MPGHVHSHFAFKNPRSSTARLIRGIRAFGQTESDDEHSESFVVAGFAPLTIPSDGRKTCIQSPTVHRLQQKKKEKRR